MKTLILSVALVLCVASARADDMTGRLGVGGSFGAATSLGMKSVENNHLGLDAGGWLRYGIRPGWSARLTYDHLGINRGTGRVEPILAGLECDMAPKSDWNPNFHFGVGPALVHHLSLVNGKTVVGANLGIGFDHFLTRWFSIGATADWFPALKSYPLQKDINVERIGLLVGFWFGGEAGSTPARAAAVPVPAPAKGGLSEAELAAAAAKLAHPEAVEVTDASRAVESSLANPKAEAASALGTAAAVAQARPKRHKRHKAAEDQQAAAASGAGAASPAAAPLKANEAYANPDYMAAPPATPHMLQEITAQPNEVRINLDQPGPFHSMFAEHPLRLVMDLLYVKYVSRDHYQPTGSRCLEGVRSDQYQTQPFPIVRVVLDLRCPIVYHTKWEGNALVVSWQDKSGAGEPARTDKP